MKKIYFLIAITAVIISQQNLLTSCTPKPETNIIEPDTIVPNIAYGFDLNNYDVFEGEVEPNWTLSHLLLPYNVSKAKVNEAYVFSKDSVGLNYIATGNKYLMLCKKDTDTIKDLQYAIYVKNRIQYYVFDFTDSAVTVKEYKKTIDTTLQKISAQIKDGGNLSFAINRSVQNNNISYPLIEEISGIYSWSIDFFHLQPGDKLKVIYEQLSVDGEDIGIGKIRAILFNHNNHDFYAFRYMVDSNQAYYNEEGKGMKSMFLTAPLKYSRVSSGYSGRRFHPVQRRWKAHLGTDYAAPRGTPIWSTANGRVIKRGRTAGNGNYVKVKHNEQYSTQYLHMSKFAEGLKVGDYVQQGQVIGYVGSTGLATGPHVCYRFWKDGKQVDARAQKFENAKPMDTTHLPKYKLFMDSVKNILDEINYPNFDIETDIELNKKDSILATEVDSLEI